MRGTNVIDDAFMHLVALYVVHLAKVATVVLGDAVEKVIRFQKILYASMIVKELT